MNEINRGGRVCVLLLLRSLQIELGDIQGHNLSLGLFIFTFSPLER